MNKFLHDFVMKTIKKMIDGGIEDYRIMQYALGWYEKQVLEQADLEQIETWIAEHEAKLVEKEAEREREALIETVEHTVETVVEEPVETVEEQPAEETVEEVVEETIEEIVEEIPEEIVE